MAEAPAIWRHCSRCKKAIACGSSYLVCSVSTCNRAGTGRAALATDAAGRSRAESGRAEDRRSEHGRSRKSVGLVFCSLDCWDAHVPVAGHRDAHAEELTAPATPEGAAEKPGDDRKVGKRRIAPVKQRDPSLPKDTLVISKALKEYIRAAGDLRTSDNVVEVLSEKLRDLCDRAIERAKQDGRKTVLDRDFLPK